MLTFRQISFSICILIASSISVLTTPAQNTNQNYPPWLTKPLSLSDALNIALENNSTIIKAKHDLEATHGLVVQTRAIIIPKLQAKGSYQIVDESYIDKIIFPSTVPISISYADQYWATSIQIVQSIYEGGRMLSSLRTSKLLKEQAYLNYETVIADTLLAVRVAYSDALLAAQQITVQEASVKLLQRELEDATRRYEAGTVPRFNVLRAEVELANAKPRLIKAKNSFRIAKNNLSNLLGYNIPHEVLEDVPLNLTDKLEVEPLNIDLPSSIAMALENRTELASLRKAEKLARESVTVARSGYLPSAQTFFGFGSKNSAFDNDLSKDLSGWFAGVQITWNIFDGFLTKGKTQEAQARLKKTQEEITDTSRKIELEVRTAYSNFIEAKEVLESTKKVEEQAEEALRLAIARNEAGTGTQLDVLNAQTSLTEARTIYITAMHDYTVAKARLERAIGYKSSFEKH